MTHYTLMNVTTWTNEMPNDLDPSIFTFDTLHKAAAPGLLKNVVAYSDLMKRMLARRYEAFYMEGV